MIRINLLGEKQDNTPLYVLQLFVAACVVILAFVSCYLFDSSLRSEIEFLEDEKALLDIQVSKLRRKTKHVTNLENKRRLLAEKLRTIARLKSKKEGPVRVLDDLTTTIPPRAWLTSVNQNSDVLEFRGVALDNQTISLFMRNLKKSKFFKNVELRYSREYMRQGINLQQFSLEAKMINLLKLSSKEKNKKGGGDLEKEKAVGASEGKDPSEKDSTEAVQQLTAPPEAAVAARTEATENGVKEAVEPDTEETSEGREL